MKKWLRTGIALLSVAVMIAIWPVGIIRTKVESKSRVTQYMLSDAIKDEIIYCQYFIPAYDYLESINIKIVRAKADAPENEGTLVCTLYNADNLKIASVSEPVSLFEDTVYHKLTFDTNVESGKQYYYTIQVIDCMNKGIRVLYSDSRKVEMEENIRMRIGEKEMPEYSTMAAYEYRINLSIDKIAMYDVWIIMMALIADELIMRKDNKDAGKKAVN